METKNRSIHELRFIQTRNAYNAAKASRNQHPQIPLDQGNSVEGILRNALEKSLGQEPEEEETPVCEFDSKNILSSTAYAPPLPVFRLDQNPRYTREYVRLIAGGKCQSKGPVLTWLECNLYESADAAYWHGILGPGPLPEIDWDEWLRVLEEIGEEKSDRRDGEEAEADCAALEAFYGKERLGAAI